MVIVLAAGTLGLLLGCIVAFLRDAFSTSFRTDVDMTERLGLRTLARIPRAGRRMSPLQIVDQARRAPMHDLSRAVRDMVVSLLESGIDRGQTVLVTSARPGEGRTTLCLLLAGVLRRLGRTALVVDCDFRNPELARIFAVSGGPDIIDALRDGAPLDRVVRHDERSGIDFIPIVGDPRSGPEIFYGSAFEALLRRLRNDYDFVIIDTPPLSASADACAINRFADRVILPVRWNATSEQLVESALRRLAQSGARPIDGVLTFVKLRTERLYRRRMHNLV
jgi:Mrp family chromosome partitioning ATPase